MWKTGKKPEFPGFFCQHPRWKVFAGFFRSVENPAVSGRKHPHFHKMRWILQGAGLRGNASGGPLSLRACGPESSSPRGGAKGFRKLSALVRRGDPRIARPRRVPDHVGRAQPVGALVYGGARDKRQPHQRPNGTALRSAQTRERESKGREPLSLWRSFPHFSGEMGPPPGRQIFNCSDRLRSTGYPSQFPPSPGRICRAFRSGRWSAGRWCGPGSGTPCRFPSGRA